MRGLVFGAFLVAGAIIAFLFIKQRPGDVYPMPVATVYDKLVRVDFGPLAEGEVALHTRKTASGNGTDTVTWAQVGDMAAFSCKFRLAPLPGDDQQTKITATCDGGSPTAGAAQGMLHNMLRNEYIERLDATLTGRAFDKQRAMGSTASRWPGDGVDGSLGTAVGTAIKMDVEQHRMQREAESQSGAAPVGDEQGNASERDSGSGQGPQ